MYSIKTFECNKRKVFVDINGNVTFSQPIATENLIQKDLMYNELPPPPLVVHHYDGNDGACLIF